MAAQLREVNRFLSALRRSVLPCSLDKIGTLLSKHHEL